MASLKKKDTNNRFDQTDSFPDEIEYLIVVEYMKRCWAISSRKSDFFFFFETKN